MKNIYKPINLLLRMALLTSFSTEAANTTQIHSKVITQTLGQKQQDYEVLKKNIEALDAEIKRTKRATQPAILVETKRKKLVSLKNELSKLKKEMPFWTERTKSILKMAGVAVATALVAYTLYRTYQESVLNGKSTKPPNFNLISSIVNIHGESYKRVVDTAINNEGSKSLTITLFDTSQKGCGHVGGDFSGDIFCLKGLGVEENFRGKGLGTYLMKQMFALAEQENARMVKWDAYPLGKEQGRQAMKNLVNWYQGLGGVAPEGIKRWGSTPMYYPINNQPSELDGSK
jgi:GNAT superfamily N-acetyltransferase